MREFELIHETVILNPDHPRVNDANRLLSFGVTPHDVSVAIKKGSNESPSPLFLDPDQKPTNGLKREVSYAVPKPKEKDKIPVITFDSINAATIKAASDIAMAVDKNEAEVVTRDGKMIVNRYVPKSS